jgi:hypothetical protein
MRTRSYSLYGRLPEHSTENYTRYHWNGELLLPNPWSVTVQTGLSPSYLRSSGVITDQLRSRKSVLREVHPCTHQKTEVNWGGLSGATATLELRQPSNEHVWTFIQHSPLSYLFKHMTSSPSDSFLLGADANDYTASVYVEPDWFVIQDAFREACDSFIPSNMLLGETLIEYGIFADIIKIAINPTRVIPSFIKMVKDYGLERKNLGYIRRTLKHASRGTLAYSFAVKPAISDITSILGAHRKVSNRFDHLVRNGGKFVPIRVRRRFFSSISNSDLSNDWNNSQHLRKQCTDKYSEACATGWGRVREELNYSEMWKAYIQYFGISKLAGLAWELVPFSFVLDWFTNTQERINFLTRPSIGSPFTEFQGITYSRKQVTKETVHLCGGYNPVLQAYMVSPNKPFGLFTIEKSNYERYLNIPSTSGVVDVSTLGLFHSITGGALLIQRFLR